MVLSVSNSNLKYFYTSPGFSVTAEEEKEQSDLAVAITDEAKRWLDKLGNSEEEIGGALSDLGIEGFAGSSTQCPVARYLSASMPELSSVRVGYTTIQFNLGSLNLSFEVSDPLGNFILDFDLTHRKFGSLFVESVEENKS